MPAIAAQRIVGLDLTDPFARAPRPVDVAVVEVSGRCAFSTLPPFQPGGRVSDWLGALSRGPGSGDVLVLDGPLALARLGTNMRQCERKLGAAGKTPDRVPLAGSRPFAGFVRGSVLLAQALVEEGWVQATSAEALDQATLLEAYPGATWTVAAGRRLPRKSTAEGRAARLALLQHSGLQFDRAPCTHDELDATLCAWLGWALHARRDVVTTAGEFAVVESGVMREGVILQVAGRWVQGVK